MIWKALFRIFLQPFLEAGAFCLYWNVFKVYEAVGHGVGTVNFWTAIGVSFVVSNILGMVGASAYIGAREAKTRLTRFDDALRRRFIK